MKQTNSKKKRDLRAGNPIYKAVCRLYFQFSEEDVADALTAESMVRRISAGEKCDDVLDSFGKENGEGSSDVIKKSVESGTKLLEKFDVVLVSAGKVFRSKEDFTEQDNMDMLGDMLCPIPGVSSSNVGGVTVRMAMNTAYADRLKKSGWGFFMPPVFKLRNPSGDGYDTIFTLEKKDANRK